MFKMLEIYYYRLFFVYLNWFWKKRWKKNVEKIFTNWENNLLHGFWKNDVKQFCKKWDETFFVGKVFEKM